MSIHVRPLRGFVVPPKLPEPISPALLDHVHERAANLQKRIADAITFFSGSMPFVYGCTGVPLRFRARSRVAAATGSSTRGVASARMRHVRSCHRRCAVAPAQNP
jgi:hypothetical protein